MALVQYSWRHIYCSGIYYICYQPLTLWHWGGPQLNDEFLTQYRLLHMHMTYAKVWTQNSSYKCNNTKHFHEIRVPRSSIFKIWINSETNSSGIIQPISSEHQHVNIILISFLNSAPSSSNTVSVAFQIHGLSETNSSRFDSTLTKMNTTKIPTSDNPFGNAVRSNTSNTV